MIWLLRLGHKLLKFFHWLFGRFALAMSKFLRGKIKLQIYFRVSWVVKNWTLLDRCGKERLWSCRTFYFLLQCATPTIGADYYCNHYPRRFFAHSGFATPPLYFLPYFQYYSLVLYLVLFSQFSCKFINKP